VKRNKEKVRETKRDKENERTMYPETARTKRTNRELGENNKKKGGE
jgi:hypothetical protein